MSVFHCGSLLMLSLCSLVRSEQDFHACGDSPIRTVHYLCVEPKVKSCNQSELEGVLLVFRDQGSEWNCIEEEMQFRFGFDGVIVHKCSNMTVCPQEEKAKYDSLVLRKNGCDPEIAKFNRLPTRVLQNRKTGYCVHPRNGLAEDGVDLHFWPSCNDDDRIRLILLKLESASKFEIANWQILNKDNVWVTCNSDKQYLQGMWRSEQVSGSADPLNLIEYGGCSSAPKPYTDQDSDCIAWPLILVSYNVWATCPSGRFLQGFYKNNDQWLPNIEKGRCCKPVDHPKSWGSCYDHDVFRTKSFFNKGWSFCKEGFYLAGIYKSYCDEIVCIETFKCCRMKKTLDAFGLTIKEIKPHDCQTIKISWEPPLIQSGPKVTEVDVVIKEEVLGKWIKNYSTPLFSQELNISGLKVGENYTVRVSATNECEERESSAPEVIRMEPTDLPDGVRSMYTDVKGCTVLLLWASPNTTCPITGYVVHYRSMQDQENWSRHYIDDAAATMYNLTLQCGMRYEVGIAIKNIVGESQILTQVIDLRSDPTDSSYTDLRSDPTDSSSFGTASIAGITVGCFLFFVSCFAACFVVKRRRREGGERKHRPTIEVLDKWEILPESMSFLEELGEGAFGKVHKATLERMIVSQGLTCEIITVAVKTLRDKSTLGDKILFEKEIDLMKRIGKHRNIVAMIGCVTLSEPMQLILEYVPHGNLLEWLRRRRTKIVNYYESIRNKDDEPLCHFDGNHKVNPMATVAEKLGQYSLRCVAATDNSCNGDVANDWRSSDPCKPNGLSALKDKTDDGNEVAFARDRPSPTQEVTCSEHINLAMMNDSEYSVVSIDATELTDIRTKTSNLRIVKENESENDSVCSSAKKHPDETDVVIFTDLLSIAWQVAQGMEYMSARDFVHRDLAARNILVGDNRIVKITDFGMTRNLDEEIYEIKHRKKIPIKWMPPETLQELVFTTKSDVWSYGIFLWEITTFGVIPYAGVDNKEISQLLKSGYRLEKPEMCSDELYDVMRQCWRENPAERPSFTQIRERLETIMQEDMPYIELMKHENYVTSCVADHEDLGPQTTSL